MNPSNVNPLETTQAQEPGTQAPGSKDFNFSDYNFDSAGVNFVGTKQPKWKFSYDGHLNIWPVDPVHGQPHHIEITGMDFYKLAQGRVYVDPDGFVEILMWKDRGTPQMRDDCVEAVDDWLELTVGKIADQVTFQGEGEGYTYDQDNDMDKMMSTYFGYPVKTKPDGSTVKA